MSSLNWNDFPPDDDDEATNGEIILALIGMLALIVLVITLIKL